MITDNAKNTIEQVLHSFKEAAPGTYKHCQSVASLIEPIAIELGLNTEDMVVAAKLHDIGKCINQEWFTENQNSENPHDDIDPSFSYCIISRHISDGVLKLIQYPEISRDIITWISEHHGDSVIQSIYNKAKKTYNGGTSIDAYRYKCQKPSSIESAALMVADSIEATIKSLHTNDKLEDIKDSVDKVVNYLIDDEQLDQLKIGHIRAIKKVLVRDLQSLYHKRVDYDTEK